MKKIILSLAILFVMSSFTTIDTTLEKINTKEVEPHMILDSCGGSHLIDDEGMTQEDIINLAVFLDWLNCEGGAGLLGGS